MYRHIIFFNFNKLLTPVEVEKIFLKIGELHSVIEGIISYSWSKNQWKNLEKHYDYCFVMDFDSQKSREAYQVHSAHKAVVEQYVLPNIQEATVCDYEIQDIFGTVKHV